MAGSVLALSKNTDSNVTQTIRIVVIVQPDQATRESGYLRSRSETSTLSYNAAHDSEDCAIEKHTAIGILSANAFNSPRIV